MTPRRWAVALILLLATAAAYSPVRENGFINYDDTSYITENPVVQQGLTWAGVKWAFSTAHTGYSHPITWLSHMLDYQLFGGWAGGHHLVSVGWHALNSLLVLMLLVRLTGAFGRSAFVAAIFALHPLHVESVAWVSERKDLLCGAFWLLTLWAYVGFVRTRKPRAFLAVVLFFLLGLLSKPMIVTLPVILLVLDFWPLRRFQSRPPGEWPGLIWEKAPLFLMSAAAAGLTWYQQHSMGIAADTGQVGLGIRFANAIVSCATYVGKSLSPGNLAIIYPHSYRIDWPATVGAFAVLLLITGLVFWFGRRREHLITGWLWFLITLLPVIGLVQVGSQAMADRYMYLPLIGLAIVATWDGWELCRSMRTRLFLPIFAVAALAGFTAMTYLQAGYWRDSVTLFRHAIAVTGDNPIAQTNLGAALSLRGEIHEAERHYAEAVRMWPDAALAHNNLGLVHASQGRTAEAIREYQLAMKLKPADARPHNNLALLHAATGEIERSEKEFLTALELKPDYVAALENFAALLAATGRASQAATELGKADQLRPGNQSLKRKLAEAQVRSGKLTEALATYRDAGRLAPDDPTLKNRVAELLAELGQFEEAAEMFGKSLQLDPNSAAARYGLARVREGQGRATDAALEYRRALEITPDAVLALNGLARLLIHHPEAGKPGEPVALAQRAAELTGNSNPVTLRTLAAAQAAAGQPADAVSTVQKALSNVSKDTTLFQELAGELEQYRQAASPNGAP